MMSVLYAQPWPLLHKQSQLLTLSALVTEGAPQASQGLRLLGPVQAESVAFSDLRSLPIKPGCLDCVLALVQEPASMSSNLTFVGALRALLRPEGLLVIVVPGSPDVRRLADIERALGSESWGITTLRHVRLKDELMFLQKVLDVGKQVRP
jgi:hypothetical protein